MHRDLKPENILLCGNSPKKARKSGQESPEAAIAIIYNCNLFMQLYVCHEMSRKNWLCVIEIKKSGEACSKLFGCNLLFMEGLPLQMHF